VSQSIIGPQTTLYLNQNQLVGAIGGEQVVWWFDGVADLRLVGSWFDEVRGWDRGTISVRNKISSHFTHQKHSSQPTNQRVAPRNDLCLSLALAPRFHACQNQTKTKQQTTAPSTRTNTLISHQTLSQKFRSINQSRQVHSFNQTRPTDCHLPPHQTAAWRVAINPSINPSIHSAVV
jgi:hypothetical protein